MIFSGGTWLDLPDGVGQFIAEEELRAHAKRPSLHYRGVAARIPQKPHPPIWVGGAFPRRPATHVIVSLCGLVEEVLGQNSPYLP
jgi:hypothetical protein